MVSWESGGYDAAATHMPPWRTNENANVTRSVFPAASKAVSKPRGTSRRTEASTSSCEASTTSVAPTCWASRKRVGTWSTATILVTPANRHPWMIERPTPPQPNTSALEPGSGFAMFNTAPRPVTTPHEATAAASSGTRSGTGTSWDTGITAYSASVPHPTKAKRSSPPAWRRDPPSGMRPRIRSILALLSQR